jgi:hypothetical protein
MHPEPGTLSGFNFWRRVTGQGSVLGDVRQRNLAIRSRDGRIRFLIRPAKMEIPAKIPTTRAGTGKDSR